MILTRNPHLVPCHLRQFLYHMYQPNAKNVCWNLPKSVGTSKVNLDQKPKNICPTSKTQSLVVTLKETNDGIFDLNIRPCFNFVYDGFQNITGQVHSNQIRNFTVASIQYLKLLLVLYHEYCAALNIRGTIFLSPAPVTRSWLYVQLRVLMQF